MTRTAKGNSSRRSGFALIALGASILAGLGRAMAPRTSNRLEQAKLEGRPPPLPGYGASPDVWGQSASCRRLVFKSRRHRRAHA